MGRAEIRRTGPGVHRSRVWLAGLAILMLITVSTHAIFAQTTMSRAQAIALIGGRLVGDLTMCGQDIKSLNLLQSLLMLYARQSARDVADGTSLDKFFAAGFHYGVREMLSGFKGCKTANDEEDALLFQYPMHGRRIVP